MPRANAAHPLHPAAPPKPTPAGREMLRLPYAPGTATAKQGDAAALDSRPDILYATVPRRLQAMHGKGLPRRDKSARAHVDAPVQAQAPIRPSVLKHLIHKEFPGSGTALVLAALRGAHVSARKRADIQALLTRKPCPTEIPAQHWF